MFEAQVLIDLSWGGRNPRVQLHHNHHHRRNQLNARAFFWCYACLCSRELQFALFGSISRGFLKRSLVDQTVAD
ncbi:hypothetical protein Hdeb2414_s0010g00356801 [Helianthus debilis subsp. tardiflorus]